MIQRFRACLTWRKREPDVNSKEVQRRNRCDSREGVSTHTPESEVWAPSGDAFYQTSFPGDQGSSGSTAAPPALRAFEDTISTTGCIGSLLFMERRVWNILYFFSRKSTSVNHTLLHFLTKLSLINLSFFIVFIPGHQFLPDFKRQEETCDQDFTFFLIALESLSQHTDLHTDVRLWI